MNKIRLRQFKTICLALYNVPHYAIYNIALYNMPHYTICLIALAFSYSKRESGSSDVYLYVRFDRVALELPSLLCTFENSAKCTRISFDSVSFFGIAN